MDAFIKDFNKIPLNLKMIIKLKKSLIKIIKLDFLIFLNNYFY